MSIRSISAASLASTQSVSAAEASHNGTTEDESEPRLSYAHFGADVPNILARNPATCLCVSDKLLAMGTQSGAVYLLDYDGNKVIFLSVFFLNN